MWSNAYLVGDAGNVSVEFDRGAWFWISWMYSYLALFAGFGFLLYRAFTEKSMFRSQMIVTILAGTIPLAANLLFLTDVNPMGDFDPTPMSFALSGVIVAFGYIRFKLFDLVPITVDILVERIPDAMFVLDRNGYVIDANPAATELAGSRAGLLIGEHLCDALPSDLSEHNLCIGDPLSVVNDIAFSDRNDVASKIYTPTVTELTEASGNGGSGGRLVILRDVTDQRRASEMLRRLARITTLNEITTAVAKMHDLESIMATVTYRLADLLPADHLTGLLMDHKTGEFVVMNTAGSHSPVPVPLESRLFDSVILTPGSDDSGHHLSDTDGHRDDLLYRFAPGCIQLWDTPLLPIARRTAQSL